MSALSSRTDRCAPRRSFLVVSSASQRSTRFSHEELVGVKCKTKRGWAVSQRWMAGVLCVEELSSTRWTARSAGTSRSMRLQELLELDRAVARVQPADDLAGADVQRGVEARRAGAFVVVGCALRDARQHRQDRRGPVQRLDLGLLVDAEHDRALGRIEVERDDVADLVDELRVAGELPGLLAVRLQAERLPDPQHRRLRQADLARHRARRPMSGVLRRGLERLDDHLLDLVIGDRSRPPRARFIGQTVQPQPRETVAPLASRADRDSQPRRRSRCC